MGILKHIVSFLTFLGERSSDLDRMNRIMECFGHFKSQGL
jgi:hypothetical protein